MGPSFYSPSKAPARGRFLRPDGGAGPSAGQGGARCRRVGESERGTNGVSTYGVTANFMMLFDRGTFWELPLTYFYLPKSARVYLFPQSIKIHYFRIGPISADPIYPQPREATGGMRRQGGSEEFVRRRQRHWQRDSGQMPRRRSGNESCTFWRRDLLRRALQASPPSFLGLAPLATEILP